MPAVISSGTLGLSNGSPYVLGSAGQAGVASQGRAGERVYVNAANGNLVIQNQDELLIGLGPDAAVLRTYNSQGQLDQDYTGDVDNWRIGFYRRVIGTSGDATIHRIDADGADSTYALQTDGTYLSHDGGGAYDKLALVGGNWTWTDGDTQVTEKYDGTTGRLMEVKDPAGNAMTVEFYASGLLKNVQTASGDKVEFSYYTETGHTNNLKQLTTTAGGTIVRTSYGYDASNRLTSVTTDLTPENTADTNTYVTTYTYVSNPNDGDNDRRLASMTQSDGTSLTFVYVDQTDKTSTKVKKITDALGRVTEFDYTSSTVTTVTQKQSASVAGIATQFTYDGSTGQLKKITIPGSTNQAVAYTYSSNGDVETVTDAATPGNTVTYTYDSSGNRLTEAHPGGTTVTRTYGSRNELESETVQGSAGPAVTTNYVYDAELNLRYSISAEGRVTEYRYDNDGLRTSTIVYTADTYSGTTFEIEDLDGWQEDADLSATQRTDTAYDPSGRGQIASITTFSAVGTDGVGLTSGKSVTYFVYDPSGKLVRTIDGRASSASDTNYNTAYAYDGLGRLLSATDALGKVTSYVYANNSANHTSTTTLKLGTTVLRVSTYDADGELISVQTQETAGAPGTTQYVYDGYGRLRGTIDPTGVRTYLFYDEAGRKVADIDGDGSLTDYRYDANGNLTRTIRRANAVSASNLADLAGTDGLNKTLAQVRPADDTTNDRSAWNVYDAANRLVNSVDELGFVTSYTYDGRGLVTDVVKYAAGITDLSTLGDTPDVSLIVHGSGSYDRHLRSFYDGDGKLVATLDAELYLTEFKYDEAGQLVETIRYADASVLPSSGPITPDALRPATSAPHFGENIHTRVEYNARGQVVRQIDGEGYFTDTAYDAAGNKTSITRYGTVGATTNGRSTGYTYDADGRLATETNAEGTITTYAYDDAGNVVEKSVATNANENAERTTRAQYDLQGRVLVELDAEGVAELLAAGTDQTKIAAAWAKHSIEHTYDAAGRRTSTTDQLDNMTRFYYDADGRLAYTVNALGEVKRSVFNAFGQLVQSVQYAKRIDGTTLDGLGGGLVGSALTNAVSAIADATRDAKTTYEYDRHGSLKLSIDALGYRTTLTYNAFGDLIGSSQEISSSSALVHEYDYDRRGQLTETRWDPGPNGTTADTKYDAFGRATETTDANGNVRKATYDKLGRVIKTEDPSGGLRYTTYDAFDRVLKQKDATGAETTYTYSDTARSVTVTTQEGVATTVTRNRHGEKISVDDGLDHVTEFKYDRNGNLLEVDAPDGSITKSEYDFAGRQTKTFDGREVETRYTYDAVGRMLTRTVDPTGLALTTKYAYDGLGQAISVVDANGVETRTSFDQKGQVVSVVVDPSGLRLETTYAYDRRGRKVNVTEGAGAPNPRVTVYQYDKLGRLEKETVDPGHLQLETNYAYDKNGNVVRKTDAEHHVTRYVYDANDRPVYVIDAANGVTKTEYDAEGRATRTTSFANGLASVPSSLTAASMDAAVAATGFADAARDRVTVSVYDRDGRERYSVDSLRGVVEKVYETGSNNVVRQVAYAMPLASNAPLTLAGIAGALQTNTHDETTLVYYDAANRPIVSVDATGAVVETVYDKNGNVTSTIAYERRVAVSSGLTLAQVRAGVAPLPQPAPPPADRVTQYVYDHANRRVYTIDAEGYVKQTRYDNLGRITQTVQYSYRVTVGTLDEAHVAAALSDSVSGGAVNATATNYVVNPVQAYTYANSASTDTVSEATQNVTLAEQNTQVSRGPSQSYTYAASARNDTATAATQSVGVSSASATVNSVQPYAYLTTAKTDSVSTATVTIGVSNATELQSSSIVNAAYTRSGTTLVSGSGLSVVTSAYSDTTPTQVRATVTRLSDNVQVAQTYTDVGYTSSESWLTPDGWDEYGNVTSYRWAYGTKWNAVSNWGGKVNLTTGSIAAGHYRVLVETWDTVQAAKAENTTYDYTDGTWSASQTFSDVVIGTLPQPTVVSWASSTQPSGTSTVTFQYRAAGSTGSYTSATVTTVSSNQQVSLSGLSNGNYEYKLEYRGASGQLLKSSAGTFTSTAGGSSSVSATFTTYTSSSAAAGSSITYYTQSSQWTPVDHVTAVVKNEAGATVSTAQTYVEAEAGYNGEVNLKTGGVLAEGRYTVELTVYKKDGTTTTVSPFTYEVPSTHIQQTISWPTSTQLSGTTPSFKYRAAGSTGAWTSATITTSGNNHQVVLGWVFAGSYDYQIEYKDSYNRVLKSASGSFTAAASGSSTPNVSFAYTAYDSQPSAGSSISGYIPTADVPMIDHVTAVVKDYFTNSTVSTADTYPEYEPSYAGNVNLKVGSVLADGRYNVTVTVYKKDGTTTNATFYYEVGQQASWMPTQPSVYIAAAKVDGTSPSTVSIGVSSPAGQPTVLSWLSSTQPSGTASATFQYRTAGSTGSYTSATVTTASPNQQVSLSGLSNGNYEYKIEYRGSSGQLLKGSAGTFTRTQGSSSSVSATFTTYTSTAASAGSSIRYYTQSSYWTPVDHVAATVKDAAFGNVVSTAQTYVEAEVGYNGEVNLKTDGVLADGRYTVELTVYRKDGTTTTVTPFLYEVGERTRLQHTISWPASTQPSDATSVTFQYRPQGSSGNWATVSVGTSGANQQVQFDWIVAGSYDYKIEYRDSYNRLIKYANGSFTAAASGSGSPNAAFKYNAYSSAAAAGSSIAGYIASAEVPTLDHVVAEVRDLSGNLVVNPAVTTYLQAPGHTGNVNLKVGSVLADGRYNVTITKYKKDGTTSAYTFYYEVGIQPLDTRTTTVSWDADNHPTGTLVEFKYRLAGSTGAYQTTNPTLANGKYKVDFQLITDDGVTVASTAPAIQLANGTYEYLVQYKSGDEVVREAKGQFTAAASGSSSTSLDFESQVYTATYTNTSVQVGQMSQQLAQPYSYIGAGRADTASTATVTIGVSNATEFQSSSIANVAYTRSGSTLVSGSGKSVVAGNVGYGDATPTQVRATVYRVSDNAQVAQTNTDVGYQSTESWSVADAWDEYGNVTHYRTAYGTKWNGVSNWGGQVNLTTGSLAPDHYRVVLETWDTAQAAQAENAFYDYTDGTWSYSNTLSNVVIGTIVKPTVLSWAASTQPSGTSSVTFQYRAAGSSDAYTSAAVSTVSSNQQVSLTGLANGGYEYKIEYRGAAGELLKTSAGTFTSTAGGSSSVSATFTGYSSAAGAGSAIHYFTQASQWAGVDYVSATVKDASGTVVSTALTYPAAEAYYNGEVNLKAGAALADGRYTVELTVHNSDGSTTTVAPFTYEVGAAPSVARTTTVSWSAASKPAAATSVEFAYTRAGQTGETTRTVATNGANYEVSFNATDGGANDPSELADGIYSYTVRYKQSGNTIASATGTFAVAAGENGTARLAFAATDVALPAHTNTFAYDHAGRLIQSTDPLGASESYTYDAVGNKLSFTNKKGAVWTYKYDEANRLTDEFSPAVDVVDAGGVLRKDVSLVTHMVYDNLGNVTERHEAYQREGEERETKYEYDVLGRQVKTLFPEVDVYNVENGVTTEDKVLSSEVTYDSLGRAVVNRATDDTYSYKVYDKAGRLAYEIDAEKYVTGYEYDAFGNQTAIVRYATKLDFAGHDDGEAWLFSDVHDFFGSHDGPEDRRIDKEYDLANRLKKVIEPQAYAYSTVSGKGALASRKTESEYDAFGEVTRSSTLFSVDAAGNDSEWSETKFFFDHRGARIAQVDAGNYLTELSYDATGNLVRQVEYARAVAADWDPTQATPLDGDATTGYDRTTTYAYDLADRKISETRVGAHYSQLSGATGVQNTTGNVTNEFAYDAVGNLVSTKDANGAIAYTYYDRLGRITGVAAPARVTTVGGPSVTPLTDFQLDAFGKTVKSTIFANGGSNVTATGYDITADPAKDQVSLFDYDSHGNLIKSRDAMEQWKYAAYDSAGRVAKTWQTFTERDVSNNVVELTKTQLFTYDALGNQVSTIDRSTPLNSADVDHPVATSVAVSLGGSVAQSASFNPQYDEYGNLIGGWQPANSVSVSWGADLTALGTGKVRVHLDYTYASGGTGSKDFDFDLPLTTGVTLSWSDSTWTSPYGIAGIGGLTLSKQDASGNWVQLHSTASGSSTKYVTWWQPDADTAKLYYGDGTSWTLATPTAMGFMTIFKVPTTATKFEMRQGADNNGTYVYQRGDLSSGTVTASTVTNEQGAAYNAFGEITAKSIDGRKTESFEYDNAGHLWRTNQGDGVDKVYLYDVQGKATAEIRSFDGNLGSYADAKAANEATHQSDHALRSETEYDKLERVTRSVLPAYGNVDPSVVHAPTTSASTASGSVSNQGGYDEYGSWVGADYVSATWSSLQGWGGGDVKIRAHVTTVQGGTFWFEGSVGSTAYESGSIGLGQDITSVDQVQVYKQNATGTYVLVRDSAVSNSRQLVMASPLAEAGDYAVLIYKNTTTSSWDGATEIVASNFGALSMVDTSVINTNGTYDYKIQFRHKAGPPYYGAAYSTSAPGTLTIATASATVSGGAAPKVEPQIKQELDRWGNVTKVTDPRYKPLVDQALSLHQTPPPEADWQKEYRYDELNHVLSETSPNVQIQDAHGNAGPGRVVTRNFYDKLGRAIAVQDANADRLDTNNNSIFEKANTATYNAGGQVIQQTHADGGIVKFKYDALGRQVEQWDALGNSTKQSFDRDNRLVSVVHPDNTGEQYEYDDLGNRTKVTDGLGHATRYAYDTRGQVVSEVKQGGQATRTYYDALGRKTLEVNANNDRQYWVYDAFGHVKSYMDLGGAKTATTYNALGLTDQAVTTVKNADGTTSTRATTNYLYDVNGALKQVNNTATAAIPTTGHPNVVQSTVYQYDAAGNRTRETFTQDGTVYADTGSIYDALNRLVEVADTRYHLTYTYDANGNRRHTAASYVDPNGSQVGPKDYWYLYDEMNRIVLTQGLKDANDNIVISVTNADNSVTKQGTLLTYDAAGNRKTAKGKSTGDLEESYNYDQNGRLIQTLRKPSDTAAAVVRSSRTYDAANNVLTLNTHDEQGRITQIQVNSYDTNGWMTQQDTVKRFYYEDEYTAPTVVDGLSSRVTYSGRDAAGNVTSYNVSVYNPQVGAGAYVNPSYQYTNYYSYEYAKFGGSYKETKVNGSSSYFQSGYTTTKYDGNGSIADVSDQFLTSKHRSFITDESGRILQKTQDSHTEYYFYAGGKPLGSSGLVDENGAPVAPDFDFNYTPVSDDYPTSTPGSVVVGNGDTLQSIALAAYGDASLWYLIADANGISSNSQLKVGMELKIPSQITNLHNTYQTFKPYEPTKIIGDLTPHLPDPPPPPQSGGGGCGFGGILMIIVIVVATVLTAGAAAIAMGATVTTGTACVTAASLGAWGAGAAVLGGAATSIGVGIAAAAIGGAVGSIAGQAFGMATGMQQKFSWSGVALGALGGAVSAGVGSVMGPAAGVVPTTAEVVGKAVVSNVITQGISVAVGLQQKFSWAAVAGAAVGAAVSQAIAPAGAKTTAGERFAAGFVGGMAGGITKSALSGGKVNFEQIAADSFGSALGNYFVDTLAAENQSAQSRNLRSAEEQAAAPNPYALAPRLTSTDTLRPSDQLLGEWANRIDRGISQAARADAQQIADSPPAAEVEKPVAPDPQGEKGPRTRIAQKNDSWAKIAREEYGDERYALALAKANRATSTTLPIGAKVELVDLSGADLKKGGAFLAADAMERSQNNAARTVASAQAATADAVVACTPSNPYGLTKAQMVQAARDLIGTFPLGGFSESPRPSAGERLLGAFEITFKGMANMGVSSAAGLIGAIDTVVRGPDAGANTVQSIQGRFSLSPSTDGGMYLANWLQGTTLVQGLENLKTNTGDYYSKYGPLAGAIGYSLPDALLMLAPAAPKAFGSVGRTAWSTTVNALPESAFMAYQRVSTAVDNTLYSLNPANYEWSGTGATFGLGVGPRGSVLSGAVEIRIPSWATAQQRAQFAEYVTIANEALDSGYLSATGRVSTKGTLRSEASLEAALERATAKLEGREYKGVVGHGPDTTWTATPKAFKWIDQDFRVNSSIGGQATRYPVGFKPTKFLLTGG